MIKPVLIRTPVISSNKHAFTVKNGQGFHCKLLPEDEKFTTKQWAPLISFERLFMNELINIW